MGMKNKTLTQMQAEVFANNVAHGWYCQSRSFGEEVALLHSEVSEMLEAYRDGDMVTYLREGDDKPLGMPSEAADVLIRLLDLCQRHSVNLEEEYEIKMKYNRTRPMRHGGKAL